VTAVERFVSGRNLEAEYRTWESWYQTISDAVVKVAGVTTRMIPPAGASPFPVMEVRWDPKKIPLTGDEVYELLLSGNPRIMSHAGGDSTTFVIRAVAMRPEHPPLVARRLAEVFGMRTHRVAPLGDGLKGTWEVDIRFTSGSTTHTWIFDDAAGGRSGHHLGQQSRGRFTVKRIGQALVLRSALPLEGMHVQYQFTGQQSGDTVSGDLDLGEFGKARFTASKVQG